MSIIMLVLGFLFLIKGADLFVEGASQIARKFNIPSMIIGLTIVAMGTSAPEASVSITSSLAGQNDMAVANIVGSNFFNILIVLGISSMIAPLPIEKNTIKKDMPFLIFVSIMMLLFAHDLDITRVEGILLGIVFIMFLVNMVKSAKQVTDKEDEVLETAIDIDVIAKESEISITKTILVSAVGIVGIVIGGDMVVNGATSIAQALGMSANLIGLTIVAIGTSLPEFVTSVMATKKGETEIAIGNVVGSNIFNILLILGLAATISPISISFIAFIDVMFMLLITLLLFVFMKKQSHLTKSQGIIFVVMYVVYMTYTIIR